MEKRGVGSIMHSHNRMTLDPRIRMEHLRLSPTRHTSRAPTAKRREVFGESHEIRTTCAEEFRTMCVHFCIRTTVLNETICILV